jgi:hypothetical protein
MSHLVIPDISVIKPHGDPPHANRQNGANGVVSCLLFAICGLSRNARCNIGVPRRLVRVPYRGDDCQECPDRRERGNPNRCCVRPWSSRWPKRPRRRGKQSDDEDQSNRHSNASADDRVARPDSQRFTRSSCDDRCHVCRAGYSDSLSSCRPSVAFGNNFEAAPTPPFRHCRGLSVAYGCN